MAIPALGSVFTLECLGTAPGGARFLDGRTLRATVGLAGDAMASGTQWALTRHAHDVVTAAELVATLNSFARQDLAMIATISTSSHQIKLVGRRSAGIALPAQLAGKRVGTVLGSSAQYFLDSWLLFHNIDPQQVKVVGFPPEQLTAALYDAPTIGASLPAEYGTVSAI